MLKPLRALIVEDSEDDTLLLVEELRRGGYDTTYVRVETAHDMEAALLREPWDIIFSDFTMPHFTAFDALAQLRKSGIDVPFIIISGTIGEDRAVLAMKAGAHDYVLKGNLRRLIPAVERELREAANRRERKQAEEKARYLAYHDPLTDLPNRLRFLEESQHVIDAALRGRGLAAMVLLDLVRFRDVNDALGHPQGDALLRQVGARLRMAAPGPALVARLGGDEFGVLLPQLSRVEDTHEVIRSISNLLSAPIMIEGVPIAVEASIGIAVAPPHADDAVTLLQRADVAMYRAKQTGSDYALYASEFESADPRRLALVAELRSAIDYGQLVLHYQPVVALRTGAVTAVEALVRWQHPRDGLLMPSAFITITEHTGLIKPLTQWVLATALRQCRTWQEQGKDWLVSVNLSARSLHDAQLPLEVDRLLKAFAVEPPRLMLEITESAIILEPKRAFETLSALREIGVMLAIDDFGTGYTSLGYIRNLPVDKIKIDKSFVLNMLANNRDAAIVRSIIDLSHHLGLRVVAEGVENRDLLQHLAALECDYAQGYSIGRPSPAEALTVPAAL